MGPHNSVQHYVFNIQFAAFKRSNNEKNDDK